MKGIDIYSGQGNVNFEQVKSSGIEIVYIKATEGVTYKDSTLLTYYNQAKAAGLNVGFYHFLRNNNPIDEANNFLNATDGLAADCKYAIDVEVTLNQSNEVITSNVRQFADYLISKGKEVCIYTSTSFYNDNLNDSVKDIPLWVAEYGVNSPQISNYIGWQYSETGSVNGISVNVDLDMFTENILLTQKEEKKVENLVVYGNDVDKRAAEYLADYMQCPVISNSVPFDYSTVVNVYAVGAGSFTSYAKTVISGVDRYDTIIQVLKHIGKL